eukprot:Gb_18651 [translate_table: standard]
MATTISIDALTRLSSLSFDCLSLERCCSFKLASSKVERFDFPDVACFSSFSSFLVDIVNRPSSETSIKVVQADEPNQQKSEILEINSVRSLFL